MFAVNEVLNTTDERDLLRQLREEATVLVLMVRLENDKRKEEWKKNKAKDYSFGLFEESDT